MLVPLVLLSIGAIAAGFVFMPYFVGEHQAEFWRGAIFTGPGNRVLEEREHLVSWVPNLPLVAAVLGTLVAAYYYLWKIGLAKRIAERRGPLYTFFYNKWFFDELYQATFVRGAKALGDLLWKGGDVSHHRPAGAERLRLALRAFRRGVGAVSSRASCTTTPSSCCWAWRAC